MRPLWSRMALLSLLLVPWQARAEPSIAVNLAVYWEGRELKEPNVDALDRLRRAFPDIPITHFVNPVYFLDPTKSTENLATLQKLVGPNDEFGLYLAPVEALVREAGLILKLSPSFWDYGEGSRACSNDCGLDVPMTVYNREESFRLFAAAHRTLQRLGFEGLRSYMVRGWLEAPYFARIAASFGYRYDLTPVDPRLLARKLSDFPVHAWVTREWKALASDDPHRQKPHQFHPHINFVPQRGGILELNEQKEILARFDQLMRDKADHPQLDEVFTLGLSMEDAFQSWPKLRLVLQNLQVRAKKQNMALRYATVSGEKNSRPNPSPMRISTKLPVEADEGLDGPENTSAGEEPK